MPLNGFHQVTGARRQQSATATHARRNGCEHVRTNSGQVVARSDATVVVEGNRYFPSGYYYYRLVVLAVPATLAWLYVSQPASVSGRLRTMVVVLTLLDLPRVALFRVAPPRFTQLIAMLVSALGRPTASAAS